MESAEKVLHNNEKPFLAIIGGAKVSDKILIIENLLDRATDIIIGGGMAIHFIKPRAVKSGILCAKMDSLDTANELLKKAEEKGVCIHLPSDSIIADKFDAHANVSGSLSNNIPDGWMGLDIGQMACETFTKVIIHSKTILWNGPMGVFEMEKFQHGTKTIAHAVADATANGAFSLVGGGDSVAAVNKFGLADKVVMCQQAAEPCWNILKEKNCPELRRSRNSADHIYKNRIAGEYTGYFYLKN